MNARWQFFETRGNGQPGWSWRRIVEGKAEITSASSFRDFGAAMRDAMAHGFQPKSDSWSSITSDGVMHFHAGERHAAQDLAHPPRPPREPDATTQN